MPEQTDVELIRAILRGFSPESGIRFPYIDDSSDKNICAPRVQKRPKTLNDDEIIALAETEFQLSYESHGKGIKSLETYMQWVLQNFRDDILYEPEVTNPHILDRDIGEMEQLMAGLTERIAKETGRVVFLGNGLSPVPIGLGIRYRQRKMHEAPVINDLLDYSALLKDLQELARRFSRGQVKFLDTYESLLKSAESLVPQIQNGNILQVRYYVGSGSPPPELRNASLIVNCFGPSLGYLEEQLSLLSPRGELYTNVSYEQLPKISGFESNPLIYTCPHTAERIQRGAKVMRVR